MQQTENSADLQKYHDLIDELAEQNKLSETTLDTAEKCKIGFRKLFITKKFSQIDEKIYRLGAEKSTDDNSSFFSAILLFESKRLAFKEEALKCPSLIKQLPKAKLKV